MTIVSYNFLILGSNTETPTDRTEYESLQRKPKIEEDKNEVYSDKIEKPKNEKSEEDEYQRELLEAIFDENELLQDFDKDKQSDGYDLEAIKREMEMNKVSLANAGSELGEVGPMLFSSEMYDDIKKLLFLFGIPYIDAPFEAESQCAFMEMTGKVDGCVTQDSDIFLFGSRHVYKDIFHENKFVEYYNMSNIENELGFDRD